MPIPIDEILRLIGRVEADLRCLYPTTDATIVLSYAAETLRLIVLDPSIDQTVSLPLYLNNECEFSKVLIEEIFNSDFFYEYLRPWPLCPFHSDAPHSLVLECWPGEIWWICAEPKRKYRQLGSLCELRRSQPPTP